MKFFLVVAVLWTLYIPELKIQLQPEPDGGMAVQEIPEQDAGQQEWSRKTVFNCVRSMDAKGNVRTYRWRDGGVFELGEECFDFPKTGAMYNP